MDPDARRRRATLLSILLLSLTIIMVPKTGAFDQDEATGMKAPANAPQMHLVPLASSSLFERQQYELNASAQAEIIRLIQRLFFTRGLNGPRVVVFAGVDAGSASSVICACAAETLARYHSGSVCLVDANPDAEPVYATVSSDLPGLAEALTATEPLRPYVATRRNLFVLPRGTERLDSPGVFVADKLCTRMKELAAAFDYVLISAAPLQSAPYSIVLGQASDGVLLVVEANSTKRESVRIAARAIVSAGIPLLGAVLNNRTYPVPEMIYRRL